MRTPHWIVLGAVVIVATWFIYRTRDTQPRVDTPIDLNWRFIAGDPQGAEKSGYDDSRWRYVSLPHDWMIEQEISPDNPSGTAGGYYPGGVAWYRKSLNLEEYLDRDQFYLLFDGVYMNADVYFNGAFLGRQVYGYASFYHDVSELVRKDTLNVIAVRVDCSRQPSDRWYSGAGIYRHVKLVATSSLHIPVWGTAVSSVLDSLGDATLRISVDMENRGRKDRRFEIRYDIVDPGGRLVAEGKSSQFLAAGQRDTAIGEFRLEDPRLWSPSSPELYTVNCYLLDRNKPIDQSSTQHGIRSVVFDPDRGFVLNGKKLMMKGVCIHHDGGALGAAVPVESWKRRLSVLKDLGVNALRLAHNPHAPEVLDLCDRMGFLVIDEMYDKWEEDWFNGRWNAPMADHWETDLANFVKRDRNHASVVLWSVGNEVVEQLNDPEKGAETYKKLLAQVRSIDPDREVSCALHPGYADRGNEIPSRMMHVSPVVSYNYRTDSFSSWHEKYPDQVFIASETRLYAPEKKEDYQQIDFGDNSWNEMEEFVAGQFIWAGIDYLGESPGWPRRGWETGLLTTSGFIKAHAWYIGSRYREDPLVRIAVKDSLLADSLNRSASWQDRWSGAPLVDHWTFEADGSEKEVVVFTNCEQVDLLLNGKEVASLRKEDFRDGVMRTRIPYIPGELVAHAHFNDDRGNEQQVSDTLATAGEAWALAMHPDRRQVQANQRDVVHITTEVVDSTGILDPHSRHLVSYKLNGPGRIRAIDNGDLAGPAGPGSASREVRHGKQLLILQAGSEPGDLIISASADGLQPSKVKIKSREP